MARTAYIGNSNIGSKISKLYIGISNLARTVTKAYIGVNGVAHLWWQQKMGPPQYLGYQSSLTNSYVCRMAGSAANTDNNMFFVGGVQEWQGGSTAVDCDMITPSLTKRIVSNAVRSSRNDRYQSAAEISSPNVVLFVSGDYSAYTSRINDSGTVSFGPDPSYAEPSTGCAMNTNAMAFIGTSGDLQQTIGLSLSTFTMQNLNNVTDSVAEGSGWYSAYNGKYLIRTGGYNLYDFDAYDNSYVYHIGGRFDLGSAYRENPDVVRIGNHVAAVGGYGGSMNTNSIYAVSQTLTTSYMGRSAEIHQFSAPCYCVDYTLLYGGNQGQVVDCIDSDFTATELAIDREIGYYGIAAFAQNVSVAFAGRNPVSSGDTYYSVVAVRFT